jgi:hypothetical protein
MFSDQANLTSGSIFDAARAGINSVSWLSNTASALILSNIG